MHTRRRRRRLAGVGLAGAAAAAAVLCVLWLSGALTRSGHQQPKQAGAPPVARTPRSAARVWTAAAQPASYALGPHGATLAAGTRVLLQRAAPDDARLLVRKGRAEFRVQPLRAGGSFVVRTRLIRVDVVGTRFVVASGERCSQVRVIEGRVRVTVRGSGEVQRLHATEERTFCDVSPLSEGLGEGGMMVRRALHLLADGKQVQQADRLLTEYLDRYPRGPFAQEALFHQVFARRRLGKQQEARALAREFVRRFPSTPRAARLRGWLDE